MKFVRLTLVLLLLTGTTANATAEVLNVTGSLWTPYLDQDLPNGGLAADLVRTALLEADYQVEATVETWPRAYRGTAVGVYDVVAAIWHSADRDQDLVFSDAYLLNDIVLLARRGIGLEFENLDDLTGYRIGVVDEYAYDEAFDTHANLTRVTNNHLVQNLLLLQRGEIDAVVGDKWSILFEISRVMPDALGDFEFLPKPIARRALRIGVSRQNNNAAEIASAFDRAISAMREDGRYDTIVARHTQGLALLPAKR